MSTGAAVIASAIIGGATSMYAADEQKKAQEEAAKKAEEARQAAEAERLRIARDTRPKQVGMTEGIKYGARDEGTTTNDFLVKKTAMKGSSVKASGVSGLGFV